MKPLYLSVTLVLLSLYSFSQYTQNFNVLVNTGTGVYSTLPDGWGIYEVESGGGVQGEGKYAVGTGSSNTGNTYSFGATGNTDRALGSIASNTLTPSYGVLFYNESDSVLTTLTITYTGEEYRYGGRTTGTQDSLKFEYSLTATGLAATGTGTWVAVTALNFKSPNITGTAAVVLDGNAAPNRQTITYTLTGLSIQPGGSILLRWSDVNIASNDDGLSIDDFSLSTDMAVGVLASGGTNTGGGTGGGGAVVDNTSTSTPIFENKVSIDSGFLYLYGNLHGHSTHSDGHPSTLEPVNDYAFAMQAQGMDFLGISEHNHSTAGLHIADYKKGIVQADTTNGKLNIAGNPFIALHGMEWGTISGGGHVVVYGYLDSLIGWETGSGPWGPTNNYDSYVAKSDYLALFDKVRSVPTAIATLAHPNSGDFTGLTGGYKGVADSAVSGVAIESGPAFSTSTTYNDFPASLAYITYYKNLLKQGYRLGANMDQDNHEMTYGTANTNRMVVLAKDRTRESLLAGIKAMRIYATNDYNAKVSFTIGNYIMGSSILSPSDLTGAISVTDGDGEGISAIQLWGGKVRGGDATLLQTATTNTTFTTSAAQGETWYYFAIITQADGNKIVTSPIWVTKPAQAPLPVTLVDFRGTLNSGVVTLTWRTATEVNSDYFVVERSTSGASFDSIGRVGATGSASSYSLIDYKPFSCTNYYRLRGVDRDGHVTYSKVVTVNLTKQFTVTVSPNPARNIVTINTNTVTAQKVVVQLIDAAGNRVYNGEHSTSGTISLDVSKYLAGIYVVRVGDVITQLLITK